MRDAPKTLREIRSDACNTILVTLAVLAVPTAAVSVLRVIEQGWVPVMGLHIAVTLMLALAALSRHRMSLSVRAAIVTAVPFVLAVGGLLSYDRGNGVMMFFVSSCVVAGCFFSRRVALGVVALCVATLAAIYMLFRFEIAGLPLNTVGYDVSPLSWLTLCTAFVLAGAPPVIALSAMHRSLEAERRRADAAIKVRSEFLANMSHELRTPMAGIIGMAEVLRFTRLDQQQQNITATLLLAGRNLLAVLNSLLDFTKFEAGNIPIERLPFRISDTLRDICAVFETRAGQKGVALRLELPQHYVDHVAGDSHRFGQVISNLIDNAVKFTEQGSVTARIAQTPLSDGTLMLSCAIVDTGIGISPNQLAGIFEPFVQADRSTSRKYGGSGLGLAICRNLAEAMGGNISVSSIPGAGSTFTVTIPFEPLRSAVAPARTLIPHHADIAPLAAPGAPSFRLLVAEDDASMRLLVDTMLSRMGHGVTVVGDGAAAVTLAGANAYDCIIMDMHMPIMNGADAMRAIRKAEAAAGAAARTPIIALTADLVPEHVREFLSAGADVVVGKPVDWGILEGWIRQLTRDRVPAAKAS
ncbi:MAG: ATP-binding protein [Rhodospirillaceae bacterium]